jgi:parallel beta-helix repeat protein
MLIAASPRFEGGRRVRRLALGVDWMRLLSAIIALVFCLSAVLGLLVSHSSGWTDTAARERPTASDLIPERALTLTAHSPILIVGNAGFTNESGVVSGSGTVPDPYVISDWDINATTAHGIEIRDSSVPFIIKHCNVHDGIDPSYRSAVRLYNCVNGILENNSCSTNNACGISLDYSSNITLNDNNCSNNDVGIFLVDSDNIAVNRNDCSNNPNGGINLASSSNNSIRDNKCLNNSIGIWLGASDSNNLLYNNNCSNNGVGINVDRSDANTLNGNTCINNDGAIQISYSSYNTIVNNECSSSRNVGMSLFLSNNNTVFNNICLNNGIVGVDLSASSGNSFASNNFSFNVEHGLIIYYAASANNSIWNNTFYHNNGATDSFDVAHVQANDGGTSNRWNSTDGYGNYWSDWTGPDDDMNGIVDVPYNISGSAKDYCPRTTPPEPIPEFAMMPLVVMVLLVAAILTGRSGRRKTY